MPSPHLHKHIIALAVLVFILVLSTVLSLPPSKPAVASNPPAVGELRGWAWSNNIGWINFNCGDEDETGAECASSNYRVSVNSTSGLLSGYAWSSNVGWISFNTSDLSSCPSGTCEAKLETTVANGKRQLTGWARVISYPAGDGFISLSKKAGEPSSDYNSSVECAVASPPAGCYGPRMDTTSGKFSGHAWGGNVVGWIDFGAITSGGGFTDGVALVLPAIPNAVISSFTATPGSLFVGESTSIAWTTQNVTTCSTSASDTSSVWDSADATVNAATSTGSLSVPVNQNTTYSITCNPGSVSANASVVANEPPPDVSTFRLTATPGVVAVSFVSNKKETSTKTNIKVEPDAGFDKLVTLTLAVDTGHVNMTQQKIDALGEVQVRARWRMRDTGPIDSDTLVQAEYNTGRDLYIEFQCTPAPANKCAVPAGDYYFKAHGVATGGGPATEDASIRVNVQSFIPSFEEQ